MTIWLHVCCADCLLRFLVASGYPLPPASQRFIKNYQTPSRQNFTDVRFQLVYLNPNIYPKSEYNARRQALESVATTLNFPLHIADYSPQDYFSLPAPATQLTTGAIDPSRCAQCQNFRLQATLDFAAAHSDNQPIKYFSSTMLASAYLDHDQIVRLGQSLTAANRTQFIYPEFTLDPAIIKTAGYFKQNYCGCLFSLAAKTRAKFAPNVV